MQSHVFFVLYQITLRLNQDSQAFNIVTLTKHDIQITMLAGWHIIHLLTLSLLSSSLHHHK